jgi:monovalent cation:H+ antiporter, CPA1 family
MEEGIHAEVAFVMLFAVATGVAMVAQRVRLPYTVALVVAGLVLGTIDAFDPPRLTKDLLYTVFLPGLLFEAAFHLEWKKFWSNKLAIHTLAVPGVVASILLTALLLTPATQALHLEVDFRFVDGLVFGGILAATDPIAVVALFKSLGAPKRLGVLVEGESLFNDGTAVVLVGIILAVAVGGELSVPSATLEFIRVVGLGGLLGAGIGYAASKIIQKVDDPMIEITVTTVAAYGSFAFAEQFHASGVIATVAAGMLCGNYGARTGMSPSTIVAAGTFWEYVAFALNSIVFLLIGFEVKVTALVENALPIVVAYLAVTLSRAIVVFSVSALLRRTRERIPWSWSAVLTWGGLRGGLSMVLVLSLVHGFPHRDYLVTVTFGVVILSILIQGLTMAPIMRRLGLVGQRAERVAFESDRAALAATRAALEEIDRFPHEQAISDGVLEAVRAEYRERLAVAEKKVQATLLATEEIQAEERVRTRRHLLLVEKERILELLHAGLVSGEAAQALLADLDGRLVALENQHHDIARPPALAAAPTPPANPPAASKETPPAS